MGLFILITAWLAGVCFQLLWPGHLGDIILGEWCQVHGLTIHVQLDGRELEMDLLRGGSEKMYQGKPPFRIRLGRSSAVKLYMDGEAVDLTPFTQDDVTQMTWPQQLEADAGEPSSN